MDIINCDIKSLVKPYFNDFDDHTIKILSQTAESFSRKAHMENSLKHICPDILAKISSTIRESYINYLNCLRTSSVGIINDELTVQTAAITAALVPDAVLKHDIEQNKSNIVSENILDLSILRRMWIYFRINDIEGSKIKYKGDKENFTNEEITKYTSLYVMLLPIFRKFLDKESGILSIHLDKMQMNILKFNNNVSVLFSHEDEKYKNTNITIFTYEIVNLYRQFCVQIES